MISQPSAAERSVSSSSEDFPTVPANYRKGAQFTPHQRRRHRAVLAALQGLSGRILDYGCGYGDLTYAMSRTHDVCGVDLDAARVNFARQEYLPLEFQVCGPDDAPYPDASFDVVTSVVVLNFIPAPHAYLQSIRRLLRRDGHLVLACANVPHVQNWFRQILRRGKAPLPACHRTQHEVRELLKAERFRVVNESYFYDGPFATWKNAGDVVIGITEQILSLLRVSATARYFIMVARKEDGER
jgi:SAM-dependent methyltransferase